MLAVTLVAVAAMQAQAGTVPPGPAAPAAPDAAAQLTTYRQALAEARQQNDQLTRALDEAKARAARADALEAKNERLVLIGNDLIAAYRKRYRRTSFGPFQFARLRFEAELQDASDQIYRNRAEVPLTPAVPAAPAPSAPSSSETPSPN